MAKTQPWINGLIDGLSASNLIRNSAIEHKNRIAFIILDSTLEIAFKKYIENVKRIPNIQESTWKSREAIIKILKKNTSFDKEVWEDTEYFYKIRTGMYHEDSEKTVSDTTIGNFQELVEFFIDNLFTIKCSEMVPLTQSLIPTKDIEPGKIPINRISERINVIVVAIAESKSKNAVEVNEFLKKKGFKGRISNSVISANINHYYSHFFYFDEYWKLSESGQERYNEIRKSYVIEQEKVNQGEKNNEG